MTVIILRRPKLGRATKFVVEKSRHIDKVIRNDKPMPNDLTLVFRWGTTSNVSCQNVVNTAEAIHRVNDKAGFRMVLMADWESKGRVGEPLCPQTHLAWNQFSLDDVDSGLIFRPRSHSQGKNIYKTYGPQMAHEAAAKCGVGYYASSFINKVAEYRVTFVQGRVVWVAKKTPGDPDAIAWNVSQGGRFDNVAWGDWPLRAVRISREAFVLSGLDFGAVDVMVDAEGRPYVLEINSAPSQTSPYRQECMAKAFDHIVVNGKAPIPVSEAKGGWKKFIHPALTPEATLVGVA